MSLVTLHDLAADRPFAALIADLVRQNVENDEGKTGILTSLRLSARIVATDIDSEAFLDFRGAGGLLVGDGHHEVPDTSPMVTIRASSDTVLDLARLRLLGSSGIPVLWDETGSSVLRAFIAGHLTIRPLLRHVGKLLQLLKVMSVHRDDHTSE